MAERLNRDPSYDLARHIITGEKGPLSGSETLRQYDAELDRNDPMEDITAGHGENIIFPRSAAAVDAANHAQAVGLGGTWGVGFQGPISMSEASANECPDAGISYGDRSERGVR